MKMAEAWFTIGGYVLAFGIAAWHWRDVVARALLGAGDAIGDLHQPDGEVVIFDFSNVEYLDDVAAEEIWSEPVGEVTFGPYDVWPFTKPLPGSEAGA